MNVKIKISVFSALALLGSIIYLFIFAIPLKENVFFKPLSSTLIPDTDITEKNLDKAQLFPFMTEKRFGYFNHDATIVHSERIAYAVALSHTAFAPYSPQNKEINIINPRGQLLAKLATAGFAHLSDTHAFVFEPGGNALACYSFAGVRQWRYEHTAIITAFNNTRQVTVVGYSDGKIVCIQNNGEILFELYPGGSKYEVVVGLALAKDGTKIACLSGIEQQRLVLIHVDQNTHQYKIVYHKYLTAGLRRQAFMCFDVAGRFVLLELVAGIGILDCDNKTFTTIDHSGDIVNAEATLTDGVFTVLTKKASIFSLLLIRKPANVLAQSSFQARNAWFEQSGQHIFLTVDNKLLKVAIRGLDSNSTY